MDSAADEFFSDSALIGISCALPGYRFCWTVNNAFGFDFVREPEFDVEYKPSRDNVHYFSLYQFEAPHSSSRHLLYKLRSEKKSLLPEIKQLDYLWLIRGFTAEVDVLVITSGLKQLPDIQLAKSLDPASLTHLNHLLI